jgi:hypothetical protein
METLKKRLKTNALFLSVIIIFQSCVAYHTTSSLEKASEEQIRTKLTKTNGERIKYKYITYEEGQFYGMNKKSGEWIKTPLDQKDISKVKSEDKGATIIGTTVLSAIALYGLLMVLYVSDI